MPDPQNKANDLNQAAAVTLAHQGRDAWNAWAEDPANADAEVDFSDYDFTDDPIDFSGFIFPGLTNFSFCTFGGDARFSGARFNGEALFINTTFGDEVMFDDATFGGEASFFHATFDGLSFFADSTFGGDTTFVGATFDGEAGFWRATFGGDAWFWRATFNGDAEFDSVKFAKGVGFKDAQFYGGANFISVGFDEPVYLDGAAFKSVPELRFAKIATHFTLHRVQVKYAETLKLWKGTYRLMAAHRDDVDRYRRLKELAMAAKDHEREQYFFALELKAKRHYETTGWALMLNYAYELFSGFGRSIMRPLVWLIVVWAGFGLGHGMFAKLDAGAPYFDGFRLSTAVLLPFVSSARTIYEGASKALYEPEPAQAWALDLAVVVESVLGLGFVFLLGLALRNRFRL